MLRLFFRVSQGFMLEGCASCRFWQKFSKFSQRNAHHWLSGFGSFLQPEMVIAENFISALSEISEDISHVQQLMILPKPLLMGTIKVTVLHGNKHRLSEIQVSHSSTRWKDDLTGCFPDSPHCDAHQQQVSLGRAELWCQSWGRTRGGEKELVKQSVKWPQDQHHEIPKLKPCNHVYCISSQLYFHLFFLTSPPPPRQKHSNQQNAIQSILQC